MITKIPNVLKLLGCQDNYYAKIDEKEMAYILSLLNNEGIIDYTYLLVEDSIVRIKSGPLCGMEGIVKKLNIHKNRVTISIPFMGSERLITCGIEIINPARCY